MSAWYTNRFRRHLCDMHIDDWDDAFLSRFSPEEYLENLKLARINAAMLYFQAHTGLCYYPTQTGRMHRAFEKEPGKMRRLVDLCHEANISVVGYYSLIYNTYEHDRRPEWRMVQKNGRSRRENEHTRYGLCCPNHPEYRAFVFAQIAEMLAYFPVEGMFFDMPFWGHVCYCPHCRGRWAREVGGEMPLGPDDVRWETVIERLHAWMGEFSQAVAEHTRALAPGVSVELNFAGAVAHDAVGVPGDQVNEACDYTGGDLYGGLYEQSFTCKYYLSASKNPPFEYMRGRFEPNLQKHTTVKPRQELETAALLTSAHHGATLMIDAIDPIGTMDKRVYRLLGEVFDKSTPYEPYLLEGELAADAAVLYHLPSKAFRRGQNFGHHESAVQAVRTLAQAHVPVAVASYRQMERLGQYPLLVASLLHSLTDAELRSLTDYVFQGGLLYFSGAEEPALLRALLGAENAGFTPHTVTYLAPLPGREALFDGFNQAYPLHFDAQAPCLTGLAPDAEVWARVKLPYTTQNNERFASIHSNPPGVDTEYPAVVFRRLGKGAVLWCAQPLEKEAGPSYARSLLALLSALGLKRSLRTDASRIVELVTFRDREGLKISAVRMQHDFEGPLPGFEILVRLDAPPQAVLLLPEKEPVPFDYADGCVRFRARPLALYDLYQIRI